MSADNYMLVRGVNKKFVVSMEFVSGDIVSSIHDEKNKWFATLEEAIEYCNTITTEYGMSIMLEEE